MGGSSKLTEEQQDWFFNRYGLQYTYVQEQHLRPSRRVRRHGARTQADAVVLQAQLDARKVLEGTRITKAIKDE